MSTGSPQSVSGAYDRIEAHEDLCAVRYENIHTAISDLKDGQKWVQRGLVALLLMVIGWCGTQMWSTVQPSAQAHQVELRR